MKTLVKLNPAILQAERVYKCFCITATSTQALLAGDLSLTSQLLTQHTCFLPSVMGYKGDRAFSFPSLQTKWDI